MNLAPPCSRCGASERRRVRKSRASEIRDWFFDGTSMGGGRDVCAQCGLESNWFTFSMSHRREMPLGAPWRIVQALRDHRSTEPVPVFYFGVLIAGTVAGIGLDLLIGFRWWLVPLAALAAAWLYFLSSAFWGVRGESLGTDVKIALWPGRALELRDAETEKVFREAPFPVFGLDEAWEGNRCLGGFGTSNGRVTELHLSHSRESPEGRMHVVVGVQTPHRPGRGSDDDLGLKLAAWNLAMQLGLPPAAPPPGENEPPWPDLDTWSPVTLSVDGEPVEFRSLMDDERWVAIGRAGQVIITVEARRFDIDLVSLRTVSDLEPYIAGTRERREQMRQAHDDL